MSVPLEDCEPVSWHSRQKHEFVRAYYEIWTEHVGHRKGSVAPSLEIIDLFASWGWCRAREPTAPADPWPGTAVLSARALNNYSNPKRLFLNTFDPDGGDAHRQQADALRRAIRGELGDRPPFKVDIHEQPLLEALTAAEKVVDFRFPNIWLLDPYNPNQLPWEVVARIASQARTYETKGKVQTRRPEMVITLMTYAMQMNIDQAPGLTSTALGMPVEDWRPQVKELVGAGLNTRQALVSIYAGRLKDLFSYDPIVLEVRGVDGIIVYELVFCTTNPAGKWMTKVRQLSKFWTWNKAEWLPEALRISQNKRIIRTGGAEAPKQRGLFDFISDET